MGKLKHNILLRLVKAVNVPLIAAPFAICWFQWYAARLVFPATAGTHALMLLLYCGIYVVFARVYDAFLVSINRISEMIYSQALAVCFADILIFVILWLMSGRFPNVLPGLGALAVQLILACVWSVLSHKWYFAVFPPKRSAVIYDLRQGMEDLIYEYGMDRKFDVRSVMSVGECLADLSALDVWEAVFLSGVRSHDRNIILKHCVEKGVDVYVIPRVGDVIMSSAKRVHLFHLPVLRVGRYDPKPEYEFFKRLADITLSAAALIITSPILLVTAIAIRSYDGGPVLYRQRRLTKDHKEFDVLKFRSMRQDAEKDGVARLSTGEKDDRITPVGHIIRKCRIDELPQLWNILRGDMSIVGPRPERPEIAAQYEQTLPEFSLRLQVKAGLTGYAQVYGKYNTTPYDKLQMDLTYIGEAGPVADLRIIFATIKILFLPESTEGVEAGQTTAMANGSMGKSANSA